MDNGGAPSMGGPGGMGGGSVPGAAGGDSFMRSARRRAIAQTMRPHQVKHNLLKAPTINHPRSGKGGIPQFSEGGSFKPEGF